MEALAIRVVGHRVQGQGTAAPFAVYTIRCTEPGADHVWQVERRWSNVRTLYYELWKKWRPQLERASSDVSPPRFVHHAYRLGSRKLDPILMAQRCRELEHLLVYFASALRISLVRDEGPEVLRLFLAESSVDFARLREFQPARRRVGLSERIGLYVPSPTAADAHKAKVIDPPYRGRTELLPGELQEACDAPTPLERFFTPQGGWPSIVAADSSRGRDANCVLLSPPRVSLHVPEMSALGNVAARAEGSCSPHPPLCPSRAPPTSKVPPQAAAEPVPIGELRVEVLEATGLPNLDTFSLTDAYAVVLWEGCAARTCTIDDDLEPKWHAESPRAFRLPILRPYSTLFVGLFDDDASSSLGALDDDDPLGRVLIQPCTLRPRTQIDCWWPLQHRTVGERPGDRGSVRLRLSVEWDDERALLVHPLRALRDAREAEASDRPAFTLPMCSRRALAAVQYTYLGAEPEARYSWPVLRSHLAEFARLGLALRAPAEPMRQVLLWRRPLVSATLLVTWQALTVYPQYIPASVPLSLLLLLDSTYRAARRRPLLHQPLPFWSLCATAVAGPLYAALGKRPVQVIPPLAASDQSADASRGRRPRRLASTHPWLMERTRHLVDSAWQMSGAPIAVGVRDALGSALAAAEAKVATWVAPATPPPPQAAGGGAPQEGAAGRAAAVDAHNKGASAASAPPPSAAARRAREADGDADEGELSRLDDDAALETVRAIAQSVRAINAAFWGAVRRALSIRPLSNRALRRALRRSSLDAVKALANSLDSNMINPAAWVLGPVQVALGELLMHAHAVQRLVTWHDAASTTLVYVGLAALTLALVLIPWAVVLPFVFTWVARLLGLALLGPHMYWVGLRLEAIAAQQQAELEARQREAELAGGPREFARRGGSAPPGPEGATASSADSPGTRGGDQGGEAVAGEEVEDVDEDDPDTYAVFEMESSRKQPRQPCWPDARSAFAFSPPPT